MVLHSGRFSRYMGSQAVCGEGCVSAMPPPRLRLGVQASRAPIWPALLLLAGPWVSLGNDGLWRPSHHGLVQGQTVLSRVPDLKEVSTGKSKTAFLPSGDTALGLRFSPS